MPFYEYRCEVCGADHEALQKISDPPLTDCPACGKPALKKRVSAAGFRLKGGGWYETDFKKQGQKRNLHDTGEKQSSDKQSSDKGDKTAAGADKNNSAAKKPDSKSGGATSPATS